MKQFKKEDFEKLSAIKEKNCISIYIPTHQAGIEVNEGMDKTTFKNEVQKIKNQLDNRGFQNKQVEELLNPAYRLLDDTSFWKDQWKGLAVFIKEKEFWIYQTPISFKAWSTLSPMFDLSPMLPVISEDDQYFTLALSQHKIRLFRNTMFTWEEINIGESAPEDVREVFSLYDFATEDKGKNMTREALKRTPGKGPLPSHGGAPQDDEYKYVMEFLRKIDKGVTEVLKNEKAPLVVAAVDNIHALYREVNSYKNILEEGVLGNPDHSNEKELHEKSLQVASSKINKSQKKDIEKYPAWAGTGKTSYHLELIMNAAHDGRVESLFIVEDNHTWGKYDEQNRKIEVHEQKQEDDICLMGLAAAKTIENNGKAYWISPQEMPEKTVSTNVSAVFRY